MTTWGFAAATACALLFVTCNAGAKISLEPGRGWVMGVVVAGAGAAYLLFRELCKNYGLAVSGGVVDSLVTIATIGLGLFFFREELSLRQYVGLAFLVAGLYLVR